MLSILPSRFLLTTSYFASWSIFFSAWNSIISRNPKWRSSTYVIEKLLDDWTHVLDNETMVDKKEKKEKEKKKRKLRFFEIKRNSSQDQNSMEVMISCIKGSRIWLNFIYLFDVFDCMLTWWRCVEPWSTLLFFIGDKSSALHKFAAANTRSPSFYIKFSQNDFACKWKLEKVGARQLLSMDHALHFHGMKKGALYQAYTWTSCVLHYMHHWWIRKPCPKFFSDPELYRVWIGNFGSIYIFLEIFCIRQKRDKIQYNKHQNWQRK